ncbi:MAG: hypothetical protein EAX95_09505 [Candidatus Thorarchaeota archaeon]|nr:hypothetical protein [Candidatus Thorarchaeota archaeon]
MKLVELASEAIRILKESGDEGIRSDILAEQLDAPKRRVYDIVAILRAQGQVRSKRKFDGTTVFWVDRSRNFVARSEHDIVIHQLSEVSEERKKLQVENAELKEKLRTTIAKVRRDVQAVESNDKVEFNTSQLCIRALSSSGIKRVRNWGFEVVVETNDPGMLVDPTEEEEDETEQLLRNLQKI